MDTKAAYTQMVQLRQAQCDLSGHLTMSQLFLYMQESAGDDSDSMGLGRDFVAENNIFWVISRVLLTVFRPAAVGERVRLVTWHGKSMRYIFPRYFALEDEAGTRLAQAATLWMLIDRGDRSIVFPSIRGFSMPDPPDMPAFPLPGKSPLRFEPDRTAQRTPVYSDFDANGHMNNARYPLWICDLFDIDLHKNNYISTIQLNFIQEIVAGESVEMGYGLEDNAFVVRGTVGGTPRFEAHGAFTPYANG